MATALIEGNDTYFEAEVLIGLHESDTLIMIGRGTSGVFFLLHDLKWGAAGTLAFSGAST